jgi:xanthine dehydrogenase YagS FAD-binding subunit
MDSADSRQLAGASSITVRADGSVRLGGSVRITDLAEHTLIRTRFAALAEAARFAAIPAPDDAGNTPDAGGARTIADDLRQRPRCSYFRDHVPCFKNGGAGCAAVDGENLHHAIFSAGPCYAVHPSDPAVVLTALEASIEVTGERGTRRSVPIADFFANAASNPDAETVLARGEMIEAVDLPARAAGGAQQYIRSMQSGERGHGFVSLAGIKRADGEVRLVLGGVSPAPYRVNPSVEEDVASGELDGESADALAERALYDAVPLSGKSSSVAQAAELLKRVMRGLSRA